MEFLHSLRESGTAESQLALAASATGILTHLLVVRNIEVERSLRSMIAIFPVLTLVLAYQSSVLWKIPLETSATRVAVGSASFFAGLATSMLLYRVFFHPLRHFPGPFPARVTKLYGTWLAGRRVMYYKDLAEMHDKYGDFVRTGPRELSIRRRSAVEIIHGPRSKCKKSTWYDQVSTSDAKSSIHMTRDTALHRSRRKVWDRAFTPKALEQYLPQIIAKVDALVTKLSSPPSQSQSPSPSQTPATQIDITKYTMLLAFDIMGLVGLGRDFDGVATGTRHPAIRAIQDHMRMLGILSHVPWLLNLLSLIPGATAGYAPFFKFCAQQVGEKRGRMLAQRDLREKNKEVEGGEGEERMVPDVMTWLIAAFDSPADKNGVPSRAALDEDSRVVIIAGSETTATTLASALYFMAKLPEEQRKLQAALDREVGDEWTYEKARGCALLEHVISETMRLHPAVKTGAPRETPPGGVMVDEVFVPGGMNVMVGIHGVQTDPRYWGERAAEFVPERWEDRSSRVGPFMPFNIGPYQCPGKALALMSLRCSISKILQNFDVAFAPGEDGVMFEAGAMDTFTTANPPCQLVFTKRVRGC